MANPYVALEDDRLMILYQQGESKAFDVLFERYQGRVYGFICRRVRQEEDRDDLFQKIFLKLHRSRHLYLDRYPFGKWIFTLAHSELMDYYRRQARLQRMRRSSQDVDSLASAEPDLDVDVSEFIGHESLSEKEQLALHLRFERDLEFAAISNRLEMAEASSRKVISRALQKLARIYRRS